jgi:hypothetical protein
VVKTTRPPTLDTLTCRCIHRFARKLWTKSVFIITDVINILPAIFKNRLIPDSQILTVFHALSAMSKCSLGVRACSTSLYQQLLSAFWTLLKLMQINAFPPGGLWWYYFINELFNIIQNCVGFMSFGEYQITPS